MRQVFFLRNIREEYILKIFSLYFIQNDVENIPDFIMYLKLYTILVRIIVVSFLLPSLKAHQFRILSSLNMARHHLILITFGNDHLRFPFHVLDLNLHNSFKFFLVFVFTTIFSIFWLLIFRIAAVLVNSCFHVFTVFRLTSKIWGYGEKLVREIVVDSSLSTTFTFNLYYVKRVVQPQNVKTVFKP